MENNAFFSEKNVGLFSASTMNTIRSIKAIIQKAAIWIFVSGVVLAAILLLAGGWAEGEAIGKTIGTLYIIGLMLIITVFDFQKIEQGEKSVQLFAFIGAVSNVVWALLWITLVWGLFDFWGVHTSYYHNSISLIGKLALISSFLSALGLFGAAVLNIDEVNKRSTIRPLKMTSICCLVYEQVFFSILTLIDFQTDSELITRLAALSGFANFVWIVSAVIAAFMSSREKAVQKAAEQNTNNNVQPAAPKTEEELRAEIEEKVRREMIEKEIRERVEKEMAEKKVNEG